MLRCEGLGKRYGQRWLFRNLDLDIPVGERLVVQGGNGSGKSTLLKVLAGLLPATEGKCDRGPDVRTSLGYAALDQPVYPVLTVREHLELSGELRQCDARVDELLDEVGLKDAAEAQGKHLSTGMRARLKFALAIQAEPAVLLLDEPGAGLDESGRNMLKDLIGRRTKDTAIVIATNDPAEYQYATYALKLD